ncbi:MAG: histidine kinase [Bacteroidia bacterium]|nr:histidine kinase [Bacteroidia bacterium]
MNHPFFKSLQHFLIYSGAWIIVTVIHAAVLLFFYNISISYSIIDGLIFNTLFALFGLSLWYIVAHSRYNKSPMLNGFITHITSAAFLLLIWISLGDFILSLFSGNNTNYDKFLSTALPWRIISGIFYYSILILIYYIINYYNALQERSIREARLNEIIRTTELDLLKSQINPHFLFNSLNSISSLTITNPAKAQEMIIKLSDFLRYTISQDSGSLVSLKEEIENAKRYLEIEQIRFGNKLQHIFNISDKCFQKLVPAMILQPLYENAVKHGVYESTEEILIKTKCTSEKNVLKIEITNNFDPEAKSRQGTGLGIKNISERLKLMFQQNNLLNINKEHNLFAVELQIPQKS